MQKPPTKCTCEFCNPPWAGLSNDSFEQDVLTRFSISVLEKQEVDFHESAFAERTTVFQPDLHPGRKREIQDVSHAGPAWNQGCCWFVAGHRKMRWHSDWHSNGKSETAVSTSSQRHRLHPQHPAAKLLQSNGGNMFRAIRALDSSGKGGGGLCVKSVIPGAQFD